MFSLLKHPYTVLSVDHEAKGIQLSNSMTTLPAAMETVDVKVEPSTIPTATLVLVADSVDIKVEPSNLTTTLCPVVDSVDVKVEPSSPTTTLFPVVGNVDIEVEPGSPTIHTLSPMMPSFEIKEEPSSPTTMLPPDTTCDDIKEQMMISYSPPPELSHESLFMNDRKPYELAALQPCIIVSTPLTSATETSQDEASMDSNPRIPGGTAVVSETQNRKSASANESRKSHGRPLLFKDCLRPKNEKKFKCKLCPSAFSQHESLKKHGELHLRGVEMFHCHKCNKMYLKEEGLLAHLRWHTIGKPYACDLCPAKFAKKAHREVHILRHKGEKPYKCSECERRFTETCDRRSHMLRMHHIGNLKSALDMSGNRQTSSAETSRNEAVRDSEPGLSAEVSGAPRQSTHTKEAVHYACELCPSKFFRKGNLESHKLLHESEMNVHKCPECSSLFKSSTILEEHQKQHNSKKRRYLCHRCPSSFTVKSQLDSHVLIHAQDNQKPHACPVCKKCFSWWPSLITHVGQEHGGVENNVAGAENSA